jgi:hypothetical protein
MVNALYDAIVNAQAATGNNDTSIDYVADTLSDSIGRAGIAVSLDGNYLLDVADTCPGCGADTASDTYNPRNGCFDMRVGACGYWRNQDAMGRARLAYYGAW